MQINLKKIFQNFNANLYLTITLFLYQLISVPIFLKFQNPEIYGIWIIIYAIPWYFLFVDLGLSYNFSIINNLITNKFKLKRSDNDILNVVFSTNILFFSFGSIVVTLSDVRISFWWSTKSWILVFILIRLASFDDEAILTVVLVTVLSPYLHRKSLRYHRLPLRQSATAMIM